MSDTSTLETTNPGTDVPVIEQIRAAALAHSPTESGDPDSYLWVAWATRKKPKHPKAFALATGKYDKSTAVLRSLNGAAVPDHAVMAQPEHDRDQFCLEIIAGRKAGTGRKALKRRGTNRASTSAADQGESASDDAGESYLAKISDKDRYAVYYRGTQVGSFPVDKLDKIDRSPNAPQLEILVTSTTWKVVQAGDTKLRGKRTSAADAADAAETAETAETAAE